MSGSALPPAQFMSVTPAATAQAWPPSAPIHLSNTDDALYPALNAAKDKCTSRFMIRSFEYRICLFECCGTEGPGTRKSVCPWPCKAFSIKWMANGCSTLTTCLRAIFTCGYLCCKDCDGCLDDQARLKGRVAPAND